MKTISDRLADVIRPTGDEDILKVAYPTPRLKIHRHHVVVIAIVCVVIIVLAANQRSTPAPSYPPTYAKEIAETVITTPITTSASSFVVVSVIGEVEKPGLYTFTPTARVADALARAGVKESANVLGINHAQMLTDGQQILVPNSAEPIEQANDPNALTAATTLVNLNTASVAELMTLSGVGSKTAEAIISYRQTHGGFRNIEQLREVKGIGAAKFEALSQEITV
ncbi:DNA uptake protein-related DNA-binding protein [Corynebacterium kutscheri]|uniref:ComEA family DNA-binding protein n=1 Tax=Corynebacterium kutscheri TaxID=35755 RepID=UPI000F70D2D6|nr:ComEA family DNA-binding protein [Corynebacterium kutscheri]VEH79298.1 DNA uptake protein-related DNA-binding protein [Corynebacterium kutscheri]